MEQGKNKLDKNHAYKYRFIKQKCFTRLIVTIELSMIKCKSAFALVTLPHSFIDIRNNKKNHYCCLLFVDFNHCVKLISRIWDQ